MLVTLSYFNYVRNRNFEIAHLVCLIFLLNNIHLKFENLCHHQQFS